MYYRSSVDPSLFAMHPLSTRRCSRHAGQSRFYSVVSTCRRIPEDEFYPSPMEYTKGWEPSSGQMLLSLNSVVSHMTSYINCGILTGCDAGQGPPDSKDPLAGYATWSLWLGLSRSLPFQHLFAFSISSHINEQASDLRRKCNSRPYPTSTSSLRQVKRIRTCARRTPERVLLLVAEAAMADLLLLALSCAQTCVADEHAEALSFGDQQPSIILLETVTTPLGTQ
jgi:hypothetical protein